MPILKCAITALLLMLGSSATAENYEGRPDITTEQVPSAPGVSQNLSNHWWSLKRGMLLFLAEIEAFYPEREVFFLGRDMEYAYDLARLLYENDPEKASRMHLINVSRRNSRSPRLRTYLKQNGLDASKLARQGVLIVDSGIRGSMIHAIRTALDLPTDNRVVEGFMLLSSDSEIPSGLVGLDPIMGLEADSKNMQYRAGVVEMLFEGLPHFTETSHDFQPFGGKLSPNSNSQNSNQKRESVALMSDLKFFARKPETLREFHLVKKEMRKIVRSAEGAIKLSSSEILESLRLIFDHGANSFLYDLSEATTVKGTLSNDPKSLSEFWRKIPNGDPYRHGRYEAIDGISHGAELKTVLRDLPEVGPFVESPKKVRNLTPDDSHLVKELIMNGNRDFMPSLIKLLERFGFEKDPELMRLLVDRVVGQYYITGLGDNNIGQLVTGPLNRDHWMKQTEYKDWILEIIWGAPAIPFSLGTLLSSRKFLAHKDASYILTKGLSNNISHFLPQIFAQSEFAMLPRSDKIFVEAINQKFISPEASLEILLSSAWLKRKESEEIFRAAASAGKMGKRFVLYSLRDVKDLGDVLHILRWLAAMPGGAVEVYSMLSGRKIDSNSTKARQFFDNLTALPQVRSLVRQYPSLGRCERSFRF